MSDKAVTVVIACYNHERFIKQAIESVVNQSYKNLELVVVDDCSTDSSREIITKVSADYKDRFSKITLQFNEHNEGAHNALNKGIAAARSNYVSLLNSDDLYQENRIDSMMNSLLSANQTNEIVFSSVLCIDESGNKLNSLKATEFESIQKRLADASFTLLACLAENIAVSTGNLLFTKKLFNMIGGFRNYKYVHDYDFLVKSCLLTEPVYDENTYYLYRLHGDNTFSKIHKTGILENRILWLDLYNQIRRKKITNPTILSLNDYMEMIGTQIKREGSKKETLWKMSINPIVKLGVSFLKKIRNI